MVAPTKIQIEPTGPEVDSRLVVFRLSANRYMKPSPIGPPHPSSSASDGRTDTYVQRPKGPTDDTCARTSPSKSCTPTQNMRGAEGVERERAAFSLAAAYASSFPTSYSLSPTRTIASGMDGPNASRRPMSARSTNSRRVALRRSAVRGRASSAHWRGGWVEGADEPSLGIDFRRRREDTARKRRAMLGDRPVYDLEDIEDENRRLKVALSRAVDENKRYRVNKMRLEGELLRADGKIDLLLAELEQTPAKRCKYTLDTRLTALHSPQQCSNISVS